MKSPVIPSRSPLSVDRRGLSLGGSADAESYDHRPTVVSDGCLRRSSPARLSSAVVSSGSLRRLSPALVSGAIAIQRQPHSLLRSALHGPRLGRSLSAVASQRQALMVSAAISIRTSRLEGVMAGEADRWRKTPNDQARADRSSTRSAYKKRRSCSGRSRRAPPPSALGGDRHMEIDLSIMGASACPALPRLVSRDEQGRVGQSRGCREARNARN